MCRGEVSIEDAKKQTTEAINYIHAYLNREGVTLRKICIELSQGTDFPGKYKTPYGELEIEVIHV